MHHPQHVLNFHRLRDHTEMTSAVVRGKKEDEVREVAQIILQISTNADKVQGSTRRRALGCKKFLPSPAWVVLSKTGPHFSGALYILNQKKYHTIAILSKSSC